MFFFNFSKNKYIKQQQKKKKNIAFVFAQNTSIQPRETR